MSQGIVRHLPLWSFDHAMCFGQTRVPNVAVEAASSEPVPSTAMRPDPCWCRYADDPTIMSWNLINEPRCYQCGDAIQVCCSSVLYAGLSPRS